MDEESVHRKFTEPLSVFLEPKHKEALREEANERSNAQKRCSTSTVARSIIADWYDNRTTKGKGK